MCLYLLILAPIFVETRQLQASDLSFGHRQVEQIAADRPEIGEVLGKNRSLRDVLAFRFGGGATGHRVYWDNREPIGGRPAEHHVSFSEYPALIRVSTSTDISAIDKCVMLVFETHNFEIDREYEMLRTASSKDLKTPVDFVIACIRHEFNAAIETQSYLASHPIAGATSENDPNYYGIIELTAKFSSYLHWLNTSDRSSYDPYRYYVHAYYKLRPSTTRQLSATGRTDTAKAVTVGKCETNKFRCGDFEGFHQQANCHCFTKDIGHGVLHPLQTGCERHCKVLKCR